MHWRVPMPHIVRYRLPGPFPADQRRSDALATEQHLTIQMHARELVEIPGGAACQLDIQPAGLAIDVLDIVRCILDVDSCDRSFPLFQLSGEGCNVYATALQKLIGAEGDEFFEYLHAPPVRIIHLTKHVSASKT